MVTSLKLLSKENFIYKVPKFVLFEIFKYFQDSSFVEDKKEISSQDTKKEQHVSKETNMNEQKNNKNCLIF